MTMGKLLVFGLLTFTLIQTPLKASDIDPLANISISKGEVLKSLENMKKAGQISEKDFNETVKAVNAMSDQNLAAIKEMAVGMARNDPDKAMALAKAPVIDLAEAERQLKALSNPKDN